MGKSENPHGQATKLTSHDSWNKIIDEVAKQANRTIDENKSALETLGASKLTLLEVVDNRNALREKLQESFKRAVDDEKFTKNFDPKTVELFKQNSNKLADHILNTTEDSRAVSGKTDIGDMTERLKHSVKEFIANII